ncbi:MAG: sigma-70 family RNA polymerase sigma factor [Clostridia bacterium]|nr:sigma-70 family RNA polymerase sigma factor [Clostridia bacterium]
MKCKYCGAELNEGELFCYRCGKQAEPEPAARFCIQCGAELEADAAFCWRCGASVDVEAGQESDSASAAGQDGAEADDRKAKTEALVVSAQGGDSDSFTELYQLYYQKVFALAKTTVKTDADAEDVLQMTFLKAWNNLDRLKNPSAFSTWIQRITLNQCYSLLRKKHADVSIDNDDEDAEPIQLESDLMLPEVYAERSDLKARLGKIIRELSAVQQQTITLYYYDELPVENIAWIMDCSVNTVKSRLFLARKSIKTEIEEQERKSGQPFYGVIGLASIPFGKLFVGQMESTALPESAAAEVLRAITKQIARRAAGAAGQAAGTAAKGAAKVGVKTATKAVSTAVSRKIIAGIVAGALATGAVAGGTAAAVSAVRKDRAETAQVQSAEETPRTAANGPYGQDLPTVQPTEDDPRQQELQAAYQAYLDCLIENKSGIDNYIWQRGYAIPLFDDNDNSYFAPLTDEYLARPVVLCDICGDEIPELMYMGDVAPGEWGNEYYYNETGANLHIVTYRDGKLVDLFSSDRSWDDAEYCFPYSLFQVEGGKELYATYAWGDLWEEDTLFCFQEGSDGKLHQTQVCRYYFEGYEGDDNGSALREPEYYYGADETEIPKEEYDRIRGSKIDHISNPLMYNYYGIWDVRPAVEQHGCAAMTCDEAIAWLEKQLEGGAPTVSLPADMPASFWQSSGVGAWSEDITFRADGTIVGEFHDTDAGWDGDGYDWTVDYSSYTCRIGSVRKINSYTYSFVVESVEYDHPIGKEEIVTDDGERIRYCYTTGSFAEGAEVTVYLRNAPIEAIPAPALELYETATAQQVMSPMPCWVLYCERTNGSFFSDPSFFTNFIKPNIKLPRLCSVKQGEYGGTIWARAELLLSLSPSCSASP